MIPRQCVLQCRRLPRVAMAMMPLCSQRRTFYDKVRVEREGSDPGPEEMFREFPRNPNPQKVPEMLHKGNHEAVRSAEALNRAFLVGLIVLMGITGLVLDPFNGDQYERPNKLEMVPVPIEKTPPRWAQKEHADMERRT